MNWLSRTPRSAALRKSSEAFSRSGVAAGALGVEHREIVHRLDVAGIGGAADTRSAPRRGPSERRGPSRRSSRADTGLARAPARRRARTRALPSACRGGRPGLPRSAPRPRTRPRCSPAIAASRSFADPIDSGSGGIAASVSSGGRRSDLSTGRRGRGRSGRGSLAGAGWRSHRFRGGSRFGRGCRLGLHLGGGVGCSSYFVGGRLCDRGRGLFLLARGLLRGRGRLSNVLRSSR